MENSNGGDTNVGSIGNSIKNERSSIEETIKIIERKIKEAEHYTDIKGLYLTLDKELCNAFINILSDYKKLQEEFREVDHECDRLEKIDFEKDTRIIELQKENEELLEVKNVQKAKYEYIDKQRKYVVDTVNKEVKMMTAADINIPVEELGLKGSPTKVKKSMTKEAKGAGEIVKESAPEAVAYVLGKLKEKHYI